MSHNCSKCGKECKDKRGLSIHEHKCGISLTDQTFSCDHCLLVFSTHDNLKKHITRCKVLKEKEIEEEKQAYINRIRQEYELKIKKMQDEFALLNQKHKNDIDAVKKNYESQVMIRDHDISSYSKEVKSKEEENKTLKDVIQRYEKQIDQLHVDSSYYKDQAFQHAILNRQAMNQGSIIGNNNTSNSNNNVYIQVFNPSLFQGHINPPDDMALTMDQLVRLLFDKGFGNYLRISDKSRNVALWNKAGEGLIKDPQCKKIVESIIDSLQPDLIKQKAWLTTKIKQLESLPETNIDKYQSYLDFTNKLIDKSDSVIDSLKKQIGIRAKDKNDSSMDPIVMRTYNSFTGSFHKFFHSRLSEFVFETVYDIGKRFSKQCHDLYHTEGGSKEKQFIILLDDRHEPRICNEAMLSSILAECLEEIFDSPQQTITQWNMIVNTYLNKDIPFFKEYQHDTFVSELLRGMIDIRIFN